MLSPHIFRSQKNISKKFNRKIILNRRDCALLLGTSFLAACENKLSSAQSEPIQPAINPPSLQMGKHIIYSYPGTTVPEELLARIADSQVGGVIFFAENISSSTQFYTIVEKIHHAALMSRDKKPILLITDEEGGLVDRIPQGGVSEKQIGQATNPAIAAYHQAQLQARLFQASLLNTNLAPVLGVYRRSGDFLDKYERSYATSATKVAVAGAAYITEFQQHHLIATAKHFPGLGSAAATANTDERPVEIPLSSPELRSVDLLPFRTAIKVGVKAIMPSWAVYPQLDPHHCAGMSPVIMQRILRHELGFTGVTITDAIEAEALARYGDTAQRAIQAFQAGNDFLCCSNRSIIQGDSAAAVLEHAYTTGRIEHRLYTTSQQRIRALFADLEG